MKYRSKFEAKVASRLGGKWGYETDSLFYTSEHAYIPDFTLVHPIRRDEKLHLEVKGRFRTSAEARKYIDVRKCNPGVNILFVFMDPYKPMPGARRRKDGSIYTHKEWAEKNEFDWIRLEDI